MKIKSDKILVGIVTVFMVTMVYFGFPAMLDAVAYQRNGGFDPKELRLIKWCNEEDRMRTEKRCNGSTVDAGYTNN